MKASEISMWVFLIILFFILAFVINTIKNSKKSTAINNFIIKDGVHAIANIINAEQHRVQNINGYLTISIEVEFSDNSKNKVITKKDITIPTLKSTDYNKGSQIKIAFHPDSPHKIVVVGENVMN